MSHHHRSRIGGLLVVGVFALSATPALALVKTVTVQRRPPVNQYCPIDNGDFDLSFVAEQPFARVTIEAFNQSPSGLFLQNRIDNFAVIAKPAYDAHVVVSPGFESCYALPGEPNSPALDFNAVGTSEALLSLFDSNANGWDRNQFAFFQAGAGASAPRDPALASDTTGGSLGLGRLEDGSVTIVTSVLVPNLTVGTEYVITGWWHVKDTSRPLEITIDGSPCLDDDGDGATSCVADCDDRNVRRRPGGIELCDGLDNDCDGSVDEVASCDRTCGVPSLVGGGPITTTADGDARHPFVAWTGTSYAVLYDRDGVDISFDRVASSGSEIGQELGLVASSRQDTSPRAVWTGSEHAVLSSTESNLLLRFFDANGQPKGQPAVVASGAYWSSDIDIAWTGTEYGIVWVGLPVQHVLFRRFAPDGTPLSPVITIGTADDSNPPSEPRIAWNGTHYGVVWKNSVVSNQLLFRRIDPLSVLSGGFPQAVTTGSPQHPAISVGGTTWGITWTDARDGNYEIYFARVASNGLKTGSDFRVTNDPATATTPVMAWSGSEWGLVWADLRSGNADLWFTRISSAGVKLVAESNITNSPGPSLEPSIVWAGGKYGVAWSDTTVAGNNEIFFTPLGCDCIDGDGDGASSCVDCADNDATTYPGAPDTCNGVSNHNCNSASWPLPAPNVDADGDGLAPCAGDCNDADAGVYPGAPFVCGGVNRDCSSASWPSTVGTPSEDLDADGFAICELDCDDANAVVWATPTEVQALTMSHSKASGLTTIRRSQGPANEGGTFITYDYLRSQVASDFVAATLCIETNGDILTTDGGIPIPGVTLYYLIRARNACPSGLGTLGSSSAGVPRAARTCP